MTETKLCNFVTSLCNLRGCHRRNFGALHVPFLPFGTFLVKGWIQRPGKKTSKYVWNQVSMAVYNGQWYCWWTKSCTTKDDDYPIIYRVLTIPGGAGFCPSTVVLVCLPFVILFHWMPKATAMMMWHPCFNEKRSLGACMDLLAPRGRMQVPVLPFWWIKIDNFLSEYIEYMNSVQHFPVFVPLSLSHRCMEAGESITPEIKKVIEEEERPRSVTGWRFGIRWIILLMYRYLC